MAFLNRQARQLLEIGPDAAVGSWDALLPLAPRDLEQLQAMALLPQARRTRMPLRVETASHRSYWMEIDVHDDPRDPERHVSCLYDLSEVYDLRRLLDDKAQFHGLVGHSAAMQLVFKPIRDVAGVDTTVLKERPARARNWSPTPSTIRAYAKRGRSRRPTARRSPNRCSPASCSAIAAARSQAPSPIRSDCSNRPRAARCSSTRSVTSRCRFRPASSACAG